MKNLALMASAIALSACAAQNAATRPAASIAADEALLVFENVCINTAPTFADAPAQASEHGIVKFEDFGFAQIGMRGDRSLSVQVQPGSECAVTTPSKSNNGLTDAFLQLVSRHVGSSVGTRVPATAQIRGTAFIFQHDRRGGEAYVMLKAPE